MPTCFKLENEGTFLNSWKLLCKNSFTQLLCRKAIKKKTNKTNLPKDSKGTEQLSSLRILCIRTITAQT